MMSNTSFTSRITFCVFFSGERFPLVYIPFHVLQTIKWRLATKSTQAPTDATSESALFTQSNTVYISTDSF